MTKGQSLDCVYQQYRGKKLAKPSRNFAFEGRLRRRVLDPAPTRRRGTAWGDVPTPGLGPKFEVSKLTVQELLVCRTDNYVHASLNTLSEEVTITYPLYPLHLLYPVFHSHPTTFIKHFMGNPLK